MLNRAPVYLNHIETAVPASEAHARFLEFLPHIIKDERTLKLVTRLASKSHIDTRYSVLTDANEPGRLDAEGLFAPGRFASTGARMQAYQKSALPLAAGPVERILDKVPAHDITHLIITSCTGFYAPGLDLELQKRFALRSDLERSIIGFMGCYAAINGLKAAAHIVRSCSDANVLIVNLELCSLHFQDSAEPEKILGCMQFADGCAASLVSAREHGLALERFRAEVFDDEADLIRWTIGDQGFDMDLSPEVSKALARALPQILPRLMSPDERAEMKLWAIHPGGRAILDVAQEKLEISAAEMAPSREVLRRYGNMSSATIMFVLRSLLENSTSRGLGAALAFGPGLTVESLIFRK